MSPFILCDKFFIMKFLPLSIYSHSELSIGENGMILELKMAVPHSFCFVVHAGDEYTLSNKHDLTLTAQQQMINTI